MKHRVFTPVCCNLLLISSLLPMNVLRTASLFSVAAALCLPAFAQLELITSRAAFPTSDTVVWSQLGTAFTTVTSPFTAATTGGSTVTVSHNPGALFERRNQNTGGWTGNFGFGDALLWNGGADNGSITVDPANLISGAGFNVQADFPGPFTFRLDVYGIGGGLLGSVTEAGFSNAVIGSAIFIGFTSPWADVDKFVATLVESTGGPSNFAINTLALSAGAGGGASPAAVPEPSVYGLMGAVVVMGLVVRERLRQHSEA
jgi:hypothetical protein